MLVSPGTGRIASSGTWMWNNQLQSHGLLNTWQLWTKMLWNSKVRIWRLTDDEAATYTARISHCRRRRIGEAAAAAAAGRRSAVSQHVIVPFVRACGAEARHVTLAYTRSYMRVIGLDWPLARCRNDVKPPRTRRLAADAAWQSRAEQADVGH